MAKAKVSKKRRRRHLKKNVRWTIAGLMMATAIVIALIPVQGGGVSAYTNDEKPIEPLGIEKIVNSTSTHALTTDLYFNADTDKVYLAYPVYGTKKINEFNASEGDIDDSTEGVIRGTKQVSFLSTDGGDNYSSSPISEISETTYYLISDVGDESISARPEYYLGTGTKEHVIAKYTDGWVDSLRLGDNETAYCSSINGTLLKEAGDVNAYYKIKTQNTNYEIQYDIATKSVQKTDENGELVWEDDEKTIPVMEEVRDDEQTEKNKQDAIRDLYTSGTPTVGAERYVLVATDGASMNKIGANAFANTSSVPSADFSNTNITDIGDGAFYHSSISGNVYMPKSIKRIGSAAFYDAGNIESFDLNPESTDVKMGCSVFTNCTRLWGSTNSANGDNSLTLYGVTSIEAGNKITGKHFISPAEERDTLDTTTITDGILANCTALSTVTFPSLTGAIPRGTFANITELGSVVVGSSNNTQSRLITFADDSDKGNEFGQIRDINKFYIWGKFQDNLDNSSESRNYAYKKNIPYRYDDGSGDEKYSFLREDGYIYNIVVTDGEGRIESIEANGNGDVGKTPSTAEPDHTMNVPYQIGNFPIVEVMDKATQPSCSTAGTTTINIPATMHRLGKDAFSGIGTLKTVNFTLEKGKNAQGNMEYFNLDDEDYKTEVDEFCFRNSPNLELVNFKTYHETNHDNLCCKMGEIMPGAFFTGSTTTQLKFRSCVPPNGDYDSASRKYKSYGQYNYCIDRSKYDPLQNGNEVPVCAYNSTGTGILYETDVPELLSFQYIANLYGEGVVSLVDYPTANEDTQMKRFKPLEDYTVKQCHDAYLNGLSNPSSVETLVFNTGKCFDEITVPYGVTSIEKLGEDNCVDHDVYSSSYFRDLDGTRTLILNDVERFKPGAFASLNRKLKAEDGSYYFAPSTLENVYFGCDVKDLGEITDFENEYPAFYQSSNVQLVKFNDGNDPVFPGTLENSEDEGHADTSNICYRFDKGIIYGYGSTSPSVGVIEPFTEVYECLPIRGAVDSGYYIPGSASDINPETDERLNSTTQIGKAAFMGCRNIDNVDLSGTSAEYYHILENAFRNSSLDQLILPTTYVDSAYGSFGDTPPNRHIKIYAYNNDDTFPANSFEGNGKSYSNQTYVYGYADPPGFKRRIDTITAEHNEAAIFKPIGREWIVQFFIVDPEDGSKRYQLKSSGEQTIIDGENAYDPANDMGYLKNDIESFGIDLDKYTFGGWDDPEELINIRSNKKIYGRMTQKDPTATYKVSFTYADPTGTDAEWHNLGELVDKYILQVVEKGNKAIYPTDDESKAILDKLYDKYVFDGWTIGGIKVDPKTLCDSVEDNLSFVAHWKETKGPYEVTFKYKDPTGVDKTLHDLGEKNKDYSPQLVEEGGKAKIPDETLAKAYLDIYEGWTFDGWNGNLEDAENVTQDLHFTALYSEIKSGPKATFMDHDGTILHTENVAVNTAPKGPSMKPSRDGYTFAGWKPDITTPITADTTYIAQYTANPTPPGPTSSSDTTTSPSSSTPSTSSGSSSDKTSSSNKSSSSSSTNKSSSSSSSSSMKPVVISGAPTPVVQPGTGASAAPGSSTAGTASSSSNVKTGNTNVVSTAPGLTNNGKMSATVNGSSDNYVVKITQTSEAENSAKEALSKNFGSLDNIKYMPFDISLYDSTGNKKIENVPAGVTVSVTMPIPDDLAVYGGNNKVASTTGGVLEPLQPRFTVIDGVPCMNYTVSHFSPYVVYVDTANLTATGTLDSTPKTADPIHPKWFLCIGLAALSIMLFLKRDKESLRAA